MANFWQQMKSNIIDPFRIVKETALPIFKKIYEWEPPGYVSPSERREVETKAKPIVQDTREYPETIKGLSLESIFKPIKKAITPSPEASEFPFVRKGSQLEDIFKSQKLFKKELEEKVGEPLAKAFVEKAPREIAIPAVKGFVKAITPEPFYEKVFKPILSERLKEPEGKVIPAIAGVAGFMTAFGMVSTGFAKLITMSPIGRAITTIAPKVARTLQITGTGLTLDQIQSPFETTIEERKKIFTVGIPRWLGFGVAMGVGPAKAWLPIIFGSQYASSKLQGQSNKDAFGQALTMTAIVSVFKILETPKSPQKMLREQALKSLGLKGGATPSEIRTTYHKLSHIYHPDLPIPTASEAKFKEISTAYSILNKNPAEFQRSIMEEIRDVYKYLRSPEGRGVALSIINEIPIGFTIKEVGKEPGKPEEIKKGIIEKGKPKMEIKPISRVPVPVPEVKPISKELELLAVEARKFDDYESFRESLRKTPDDFNKIKMEYQKLEKVKKGEAGYNIGAYRIINNPFQDFYNQAVKGVKEVKPEEVKPKTMAEMLKPEVKPGEAELSKIYQEEFDKIKKAGEKQIFDDIKSAGGLKVDPTLKEEMSDLPIDVMRTTGIMPDEMVEILNLKGYKLKSSSDLFEAIKSIRKMPTGYKVAKTPSEINLGIIRTIRTKIPTPKTLTSAQLERMEKRLIKESTVGKAIPPKRIIERVTGIKLFPEKEVIIKERRLLKMKLRAEVKGARVSAKETRKSILADLAEKKKTVESVRKSIVKYATEYLTLESRGKLLVKVRDAKTYEDLTVAQNYIKAIDRRMEKKLEVAGLRKNIEKMDLKKMRPEYKERIEGILSDLDIMNTSDRKLERLSKTKEYLEENPDAIMPERMLRELEKIDKKRLRDLDAREIRLINDAISHQVKLEKLKNKLIFGKRYFELKDAIEKAVKNINSKVVEIKSDSNLIDSSIKEPRVGSLRQIFTVDSYNPELITEILDRKKHGVIKRVIYGGIDEGITAVLRDQQEAHDMIEKEIKGINIEKWSTHFQAKEKNIDYQTTRMTNGREIKITKGDRISFILHSKNNKNLNHLLKGGFRFESNPLKKYKISKEDLNVIVDSATPEEKKVADVFYNFMNVFQKGKLNEISLDLNGWEIATERNYWPIRTIRLDRIRDELKLSKNFNQSTLEGMGILKERTNAKNALIIEDAFKVIYSHLKKTSAYYGLAKPLRNAKMLLHDGGFIKNVEKVYGRHYQKALEEYIKAVEGTSQDTEGIEKLTADIINKLDVAILGMNPFVMLKQPVSYLMAATEIDIKYLIKAIKTTVPAEEIKKMSPQLRDRFEGNVNRELGELGNVGAIRKFFTGKTVLSNKLMDGIRKFDYGTIGRVWNAVKFEVKDLHPELKGDDYMKAVTKRAEEVIRLTQLTFNIKDRSAIARSKNIFVRIMTKYTSQRNKNYNAIRRSLLKYDTSGHGNKDKAKVAKDLFIILIASSFLIDMIDELRNRLYGRKKQGLFSHAVNVVSNSMSYVYFIGGLFQSIISKIKYGSYGGYGGFMANNPVESFLDNAMKGIADTYNAIDQAITKERYKSGEKKGEYKWKTSIMRAINEVISTTSKIKGIPYDTVRKILAGVWRIMSGKETEEETKIKPIKIKLIGKGIKIKTMSDIFKGREMKTPVLGK